MVEVAAGKHRAPDEQPEQPEQVVQPEQPEERHAAPTLPIPAELTSRFEEAERLLNAAEAPGALRFGDPITNLRLPKPASPHYDRTNSAVGVAEFVKHVWGHVSIDEACNAVQGLSQGVAQYGAGPIRRRVFEAPIDSWRESSSLWTFVESLRAFYGASDADHCLRNDLKNGDEYGTNIFVGHSRRERFLLVDRAAMLRTLSGRPYIGRVIDFVDIMRRPLDIARRQTQLHTALNEFSLPEELAVQAALTQKGLDEETRTRLMRNATRLNVRSLGDLEILIRTSQEREAREQNGLRAKLASLTTWRTVEPDPNWPDDMLRHDE